MERLAKSTRYSIVDMLPQSSRAFGALRCETDPSRVTWTEFEASCASVDESRALAMWLLAVDHVLGGEQIGIALPSGWLELRVDRSMSIANWTRAVRELMNSPLNESSADVELAWGGVETRGRAGLLSIARCVDGRCTASFVDSQVSAAGAAILVALWSAALRASADLAIADIAWSDAVAPSLVGAREWRHRGPRDIPANFDEVARRNPAAVAVVEAARQWTYAEIDELAREIAGALLGEGVGSGEIVAIGLPRGGAAIAAMLGILRAGAAYLPVDLADPPDRLRYLIEDSAVRLLIADRAANGACEQLPVKWLDVTRIEATGAVALPALDGGMVAYVMYTSGSTGQPKGVEVRHQGVTRLVVACNFMQLDAATAMLHAAPLGFDASTLEIWGPLLNGGRCIVHDEAVPTGAGLADTIRSRGARSAWLTAALFNAVVDDDPRHLSELDTLLIGGEALSTSHVKRFLAVAPQTSLHNGYGPTETTTFATTYPIVPADIENASSVPIGRPINATGLYVLNPRGEPVPRGLIGELYIGGLGVGRGYLRRPELTSERFLPDPFAATQLPDVASATPAAGQSIAAAEPVMYRTGDQVCMRADGVLEFVGRIDGQVKVRGFRVETSEIELALSRCRDVRTCAVIAQRDHVRGVELVAYVVPSSSSFSPAALKLELGQTLPDYMVPTQWVRLEALPVTTNGKLDRRHLPAPRRERPEHLAQPYVAPLAGPERDVADAMTQVLGIDRVGALDNFFDLGGNSLLVLRAHAAIREAGYDGLSVTRFFADATPRAIARYLGAAVSPRAADVTRIQGLGAEPVAVIGMSGRFPGARDIDSLWQVLCDGRDTIRFFSPDELDQSIPNALRHDARYVAARGVIDDVEMFDAAFFGISPREAELMDPQQRIFLEIAWECLERAGQVPEKTHAPIGVFAGMNNATYFANHIQAYPEKVARFGEFMVMLANEKDYITTRTAHKLGLRGPAVCVQSACSTSLVAIAQAFDALRAGQCGLALAGGASITCPPNSGYLYQDGAMLSPDGHTRTFDADAQGTVFSDGAAVVLLKRLSDAIADGNTIYAVIRGVAVNNDGAERASFTAPSVSGQTALIRAALEHADVDARSIDYVEAHGTATPLGDPIEVAALTDAYREHTSDVGFCALGSLKSNTGHMVIAAGAGGFIKTALSLYNETLPASLHFTTPNPKLDLASSPFFVNGERRAWPRVAKPRRAGVSSFGVGGTNAHAILEEAPLAPASKPSEGPQLLRLSARTSPALAQMLGRLADHLERSPGTNLADVAHTLDVGRRDFAQRAVVVAERVDEAIGLLRERASPRSMAAAPAVAERRPVLMFPGQGSQYASMGRDLYEFDPDFRRTMDACFDAVGDVVDFDLRARMFSGDPAVLAQTEVTQPATFALEYALAKLWLQQGVDPAALVGHSVGEFVAATLAGVMSFEDAIRLVARRGTMMQSLPTGAMLSVRLGAAELEPLLPDTVQLAAENGPTACVVAGPASEVDALAARLEARGSATRRLKTSHAFHSAMMDPAVPELEAAVRGVTLAAPRMQIASTLTGAWLTAEEATDPGYWARHMRQPVRFSRAVRHLVENVAAPLFIEVGPGTALCSLVRQHREAGKVAIALASLAAEAGREVRTLTEAAGQLWQAGCAIAWPPEKAAGRRRIVLPTYPFERQRHWLDTVCRSTPSQVVRLAPPPASQPSASPVAAALAVATDRPAISAPEVQTATVIQVSTRTSTASAPTTPMSPPSMSNRHTKLVQRLRVVFEDVSGIELEDADASLSFVELGLDSLTLTQVALQLKNEFALPITFRQLMESLRTFDDLAGFLDAQLPAEVVAAAAVAPQPAAAVAAAVADTLAPPIAAAPAVPMPVAAMVPQAMTMPTAGLPMIQQLIQQQMALMSQQLLLLQGQPLTAAAPVASLAAAPVAVPVSVPVPAPVAAQASAVAPPATAQVGAQAAASAPPVAPRAAQPAPAAAASADSEQALAHTTYDVKKAFGAIARIHTTKTDMTDRQRGRLDAFMRRYIEKTQRSKSYTTEHRPHLADPRVVNGFRPQLKEIIYQIVIERSKGARVWDLDGNEYVDALSGFGMSLFGWQPDFILDAVRQQLDSGYEIGPQHPLAGPVAKLVCELTGFDRAGLCNTGSEAVMGCVRVARTVTGRSKIAMFTGAYHGIFDEVIVRGTRKGRAVPAAPGIMKNTSENVTVLDYGTPETLQWLKENAAELAAVLVEPVQSRRPDFQPREFLHELRRLTTDNGALLIFDEVVTGFRSHPGGAQAIFGIRADLASYGKVVGGGFPIGIIAGKREYMDALDGGHWQFGDDSIPTVGVTYFAGTFVRHPLALAAAHAVLVHLKEAGPKLQETTNANTAALVAELNAYCSEVGAPISIKHFSSVWKIFFDEDHPYQDLLFAMMRNRGVHILDNFPCFMTTAHDAKALSVIKTAFKEAVAELQQSDFLPRRSKANVLAFDASRPPRPDARLGRDADGKPAWFVANPDAPGKYIKVEAQ